MLQHDVLHNYYYRFSVHSPCFLTSKSSLLLFISPYGVRTLSCVNGRNEQLDGNNAGDNTTKCWDEVKNSSLCFKDPIIGEVGPREDLF